MYNLIFWSRKTSSSLQVNGGRGIFNYGYDITIGEYQKYFENDMNYDNNLKWVQDSLYNIPPPSPKIYKFLITDFIQ